MGNDYKKIIWIAAFAAFAAVSCWATAESLHLLLYTWPLAICWIVTAGFFVIAAIGTKMIADAFNTNIYMEGRGLKITGGVLIVIIFWLLCSMPTNTHTFFYRTSVSDVINSDIATTQGYLRQIEGNSKNTALAQAKIDSLNNAVDVLLGELEAEIRNEANPGDGPKSQEIRRRLAKLLSVDKIDKLSYTGLSEQQRTTLCDAYRSKIYILAQARAENIRKSVQAPTAQNLRRANAADRELARLKADIDAGRIDLNDAEDIAAACDVLTKGYNEVDINADYVKFKSPDDRERYTADNPVSQTKRLSSVFDVWSDFIGGKYAGRGMIFWVIISVLVDIAAFIFFDLAFRRNDVY